MKIKIRSNVTRVLKEPAHVVGKLGKGVGSLVRFRTRGDLVHDGAGVSVTLERGNDRIPIVDALTGENMSLVEHTRGIAEVVGNMKCVYFYPTGGQRVDKVGVVLKKRVVGVKNGSRARAGKKRDHLARAVAKTGAGQIFYRKEHAVLR